MFYLTKPSTHFIFGYVASPSRTTQRERKLALAARDLLYAPSHKQDTMTFDIPVV